MKRISIIVTSLLTLTLASCLKDRPNTDFSGTQSQYIAEITTSSTNGTLNAPSAGSSTYFGGSNLNFSGADDPDTISFTVNIASDFPPTKDIALTLGVDPQALANYNAGGPPTLFEQFPDSTASFPVKTATIKAGSRLATFYVYFHPDKIDPTHSYMLPISITSAPGTTISGNFGTIYYHMIGNPLAGNYTDEWIRYNTATQTGSPAFDQLSTVSFVPVTPTQVSITDPTGMAYQLSFDNSGGTLSNFTVAFPKSGSGSADAAGITITGGPTIVLADPVNKKFTFNFTYNNSAGAARNITDIFTP